MNRWQLIQRVIDRLQVAIIYIVIGWIALPARVFIPVMIAWVVVVWLQRRERHMYRPRRFRWAALLVTLSLFVVWMAFRLPDNLSGNPIHWGHSLAILWVPMLLVAVPTIYLWTDRRTPPPHCCRECGYDLTGNVSGVCPECGRKLSRRQG